MLAHLAAVFAAFQRFLFVDFPRGDTFTSTYYAKADMLKPLEDRKALMDDRFAGYKGLCMWGLGSLFWGSVTGVLSIFVEPKPSWIEYVYSYAVIAFVLLLNGAVASTFPSTALLAPFMAGLGGWQALILFLETFHIASLKYHNYLDECLYSMFASSIVVIVYWALSCQDPLLLHILVKFILWIIGLVVYAIGFILYLIMIWVVSGLGWLFYTSWGFAWTNEDSLKNHLVARYNQSREYQPLAFYPVIYSHHQSTGLLH